MVNRGRTGEPLIYLIDEIFGGTNSRDRHEGAVAVLETLTTHGGIGLVSTHDLKLCELAETAPERYRNLHFEEQYVDGTITFDYTLRPGPSTTSNALEMIRMVGIEV
jgi:DNA mismatch repair ATPase MutS